ncbi:MAG: IclR family transcriptional regulator [Alphaproteobacteria bacterium]|nr:IclR family transcriptional regulator [Alphaproteobacteria bacterium]
MRLLKSLTRGLDALDLLVAADEPMRLTQVAEHLGVDKSNASHILRTLVAAGYGQQVDGRRYAPGPKSSRRRRSELEDVIARREKFHDLLIKLVDLTSECAHMAVPVGDKVWYIDKIASPLPLKVDHPIGSLAPLHCTALGKAFLAFGDIQHVGTLERFTVNTICEQSALRAEISATRLRGYAIDNEEFSTGVSCVAAPIYDSDGRMAAAIGLSGPAARNNPSRLAELGNLLLANTIENINPRPKAMQS